MKIISLILLLPMSIFATMGAHSVGRVMGVYDYTVNTNPPHITSVVPSKPRLLKDCRINGAHITDTIYFNTVRMDSTVSSTSNSVTKYVYGLPVVANALYWVKAVNEYGRDSIRVHVKNMTDTLIWSRP